MVPRFQLEVGRYAIFKSLIGYFNYSLLDVGPIRFQRFQRASKR